MIVDEFDYSTVKSSVQAIFNTQQDIGKGIRAMLIKRLADANKVVVVERAKINQLMAEQDRNTSNRVKQGSGARVGQISGADAVLAGDIIIFGRDDKKTNIGGGGFSRLGGFGGIHIKKEEDKAVVAIDYRLIDAETSEVIATGEARGESVRKSSGIGGFGGAWGGGGGGGGIDMTSSNFGSTIIGEATQDCVNKLSDILNQQTTTMKKAVRPVEARVADVSGGTLVITAGSNDGVNVGDVFEVLKVVREVRDPATKEVLDTITQKTGEMTITSVREKIATGNYAGSAAGVGFIARKKTSGRSAMKIQAAVVVLLACAAVGSAQTKKALSIDPFDYSAVMTAVQSIFGTQVNIGQGIQAMMTQAHRAGRPLHRGGAPQSERGDA